VTSGTIGIASAVIRYEPRSGSSILSAFAHKVHTSSIDCKEL